MAPKGLQTSGYGAATAPALVPPVKDPVQAALALRSQGRFQDALDLLSEAANLTTDAYVLRGDLLTDLGRVADAAGSYYSATVSAPGNLYARSHLASCLRRMGRWEEAAEAFQTVLQADPHRDPLLLELGDCLLRLNRLEQALSCFDQCWSETAQCHAWFGKAVTLQRLGRLEDAEVAYERVLALDGKAEEALANLIALSLEGFDLEQVWRYSLRLLEINPRSVPGLQGLTLVAVERGEIETAARHFSTLAELAPESIRPTREASDDSIDYRVSRKAIERIKEFMRSQSASPAARRD